MIILTRGRLCCMRPHYMPNGNAINITIEAFYCFPKPGLQYNWHYAHLPTHAQQNIVFCEPGLRFIDMRQRMRTSFWGLVWHFNDRHVHVLPTWFRKQDFLSIHPCNVLNMSNSQKRDLKPARVLLSTHSTRRSPSDYDHSLVEWAHGGKSHWQWPHPSLLCKDGIENRISGVSTCEWLSYHPCSVSIFRK